MTPHLKPYPAMKNFGAEWLGEVPEHWEVRRVKVPVSRIVGGSTPSSNEPRYWDGDYIWVTPTDISQTTRIQSSQRRLTQAGLNNCSAEWLPAGSIVVSSRAPVGNVALAEVPFCTNQGCKSLILNQNRISSSFALYLFRILKAEMQSLANGTTFTEISTNRLGNIRVPLPPLPEQTAIVRYLDYVDRRVRRLTRAKRKLVALLTEQKQVIIHRAVTRGLAPDVPMKDSGVEWLGEVPEHWEVTRLKSHLIRNDSGIWGDNFSETGTIVLRSTEQTVNGGWRIKDPAKIKLPPKEVESALLETGDLVVTKSSGSQAHIGKTSEVISSIASLGCCFSNFMQRLRMDSDTLPTFVWYNLNSRVGREQLVFQSTTTTGLGNLNGTILGNCLFSFPPTPEQTAIVEYLDQATTGIDAAIARADREIELLDEYRVRLIADVVTGKLDVREAAATLPEEDSLAAEDVKSTSYEKPVMDINNSDAPLDTAAS